MLKSKLSLYSWIALLLLLISCSSFECNNCVRSLNDSGQNSIRSLVDSSQSGAVVRFDPKLSNQTIILESPIILDKDISIEGDGKVTLSGNDKVRIFQINEGVTAYLSGLNLENGFSNDELGIGGAIFNAGELHLKDVSVRNSTSREGGGIFNWNSLYIEDSVFENNTTQFDNGGAISNGGSAHISNSSFINNKSIRGGGAIAHLGLGNAELVITESVFTNNHCEVLGGALLLGEGNIRVQDSLFDKNDSEDGGGAIAAFPVFKFEGPQKALMIENNTFSQNKTLGSGGTINIDIPSYEVSIIGNSIVDNQASGLGGGIAFFDSSAEGFSITNSQDSIHNNLNFASLDEFNPKLRFQSASLAHNLILQSIDTHPKAKENNYTVLEETKSSKGDITLQDNLFHKNDAHDGGGAISVSLNAKFQELQREFLLANNTLYQNKTSRSGGGFLIHIQSAQTAYKVRILNNSIVDNQASDLGAGIIFLSDNDIAKEIFSTAELQGNISAGNLSNKDIPPNDIFSHGQIKPVSLGQNLILHNFPDFVNFELKGNDIIGVEPQLAELADNGGNTMSLIPKPQSPVIDRIPAADCPLNNDQRGVKRPKDGDGDGITKCDIGAVEF